MINTLWKNNILYLPSGLISIYKQKLVDLSMLTHAENYKEDGNGATGGMTQAETEKHFAERFLTSSARIQFITIDPRGDFEYISKDLQSTFGSGEISILDIPCGTGASILSLLFTIYELRKESSLPRLPLHINILGGDYSEFALDIYRELLDNVCTSFETEMIYITFQAHTWNAIDTTSTNLLLNEWLEQNNSEEFYVLISAFSGVGSSIYKNFTSSFDYIQARISHLPATMVFVEPTTNEGNIFLKHIHKIIDKISIFLNIKEESTKNNRFEWYDPIRNNNAKSGVTIKLYRREIA